MNYLKTIIAFIVLINLDYMVGGQTSEWIVPADKKAKLCSYPFNDSIRKHGKEIFENNCISCHGHPGLSDGQKFTPPPPDPVSSKMQQNTDGDMFYKITEGRGQMSSFKDILSQEDIWAVIAYFRSFNKNYVQQIEKVVEKKGYSGDVAIQISYDDSKKALLAKIIGTRLNQSEPLENVEVKLFVNRRFGNLQIDETKTSNSKGEVEFIVPKNIPGDSIGYLKILARLTDKELYGDVSSDTSLAIGVPTNLPGLTQERALWNKMRKAPIWLLITYFGGVLVAWGTIFYILLQLRKIFFIGKNNTVPN
jgi:hypothetical protein